MIKAILADDELPATARMKKLLLPYEDILIVGEAHDGLSTLSLVEEKNPDIVFLDIDMPELSGLGVAQTLGVSGPLIIFVTAHDEHALAAFESSAIDYLVKPVNPTRLDFTIKKIRRAISEGKRTSLNPLFSKMESTGRRAQFAVKVGAKFEVFEPSSISAVIAQDHYASLVINGRELLSNDSLESILTRLDPAIFTRVHRSAIINMKFLKELKREGDRKYAAILSDKNQTRVSVSRERLPYLKKILGLID